MIMSSMADINANFMIALPEIFIAGMIILLLLVDAFFKNSRERNSFAIVGTTLMIACYLQFQIFMVHINEQIMLTFNNMFILDSLAIVMKIATYLTGLVILIYIRQYLKNHNILSSEFYVIFLFAILGMLVMISANNLLILYVGLELLSLALYGLIAINYNNIKSTEAAMKFFILGALASGLLLYGISFIYGATGGYLQLEQVFYSIHNGQGVNHSILVFGLVFIVSGLVFKLGLAPFHMWIPDVYEGSPLPVTTIIGTITKIAGVVFILRFLVSGLVELSGEWSTMLGLLAFISLFIGNIVAIAQTNIKRMLGYSTIAHMAFIAFGLMTLSVNGFHAVLFYLLTYVLTALAGFGVLMILSDGGYECENIDDLKGLAKTHPIYAGIMLLVMFSLAGIPPLVGFYAKFKILEALINIGYVSTAIYAVVMSLIGAFYYLRVVKVMYFDDKVLDIKVIKANYVVKSVVIINGLLLLVLGFMPNTILNLCTYIIGR